VSDLDEIGEIIAAHHERFDGSGYPLGISGDEIPMISRIVSVADAYSAMVSDRPYRRALSTDEAVDQLVKGSGTSFDPEIILAFTELLNDRSHKYRSSGDTNFELEFQKVRLLEQIH
jgi:HD-GYP domain-containing protein (c-di-GMP phosphodiesterase class II)